MTWTSRNICSDRCRDGLVQVFIERGNSTQVALGFVINFVVYSVNLAVSPIYHQEVRAQQ